MNSLGEIIASTTAKHTRWELKEKLSEERLSELDSILLNERGIVNLRPGSFFDSLDWDELRTWLHFRAIYGLPTIELVEWLNKKLGHWKKRTIEIGCGGGHLAYYLGVPAYDSKFQLRPEVKAYYELHRQPIIKYPSFVLEGECNEVVEKVRPHTVILQWGSQKSYKNSPLDGGCCGGIEYDWLYQKVKQIILIGCTDIHSNINIMKVEHEEFIFPWIKSRNRHTNRIFVWNNKKWKP